MGRTVVVAICLLVASARAQPLVSPGPLSLSHDQLKCNDCHRGGLRAVANAACVGCHDHDRLASRIRSKVGFHASKDVEGRSCTTCHSEHQGEQFDLRGWATLPNGEAGFDHALTRWDLAPHKRVPCVRCHQTNDRQGLRTYLDATALVDVSGKVDCMACHAGVHAQRYTNDQCMLCHARSRAEPPGDRFLVRIHGEDGTFALRGGHATVTCNTCHPGDVYQTTDPNCNASGCHDDRLHRGSLGDRCTSCHESGGWAATRFDHELSAPLGSHRDQDCSSCHPNRAFAVGTCVTNACHANDDAHRGALGAACARCHLANGDLVFSHDAAVFKLEGKHLEVPCGDCHFSVAFKPRPTTCVGCHPDPHRGRRGRDCERCHTAASFRVAKPAG